ncbi:MAG TPA: hypothetical protein VFK79_05330 [Xanthobacteraceae bacterium]|nr:hypothetical protein [Xanthobacteraceae bacterium]
MLLLSPKFFVLPLAAVLIICALPRAQTVSDHPVVAAQKGVLKLSSPKTNLLQVENIAGRTMRFASAAGTETRHH